MSEPVVLDGVVWSCFWVVWFGFGVPPRDFLFVGLLVAGKNIGRWIGFGFLVTFAAYLSFSLLT